MAFDLLSGKVDGKKWGRGEEGSVVVGGWADGLLMKSLPWNKIAVIGSAAFGVLFVIPRLLKLWEDKKLRAAHHEWDPEETKQIPRQRMKQLVGVED